jgi:phosphoserine phosphatase
MIVVDFDNTLIKVNSFPRWVFFTMTRSLLAGRFALFMRMAVLLARRKISRHISHKEFKSSLLLLGLPDKWQRQFARKLLFFMRGEIHSDIAGYIKKGNDVVLCSAAPQGYLEYFAGAAFEELKGQKGRVFAIGSGIVAGRLYDNSGADKVDSIKNRFNGAPVNVLYTNSCDDMPLAEMAEKVYLVGPSEKDLACYVRAFPGKTVLYEKR